MAQHFLLSAKARTLSLAAVLRLSDDEAYSTFKAIRFAANQGEPFCPKCGSVTVYEFKTRRMFKCKECERQFSATSGTIFASRKLNVRDILAAIAIFVNGAKGHSTLQLSRDLDVQYKTAFFGGYVKPANYKENRRDRRYLENQNGKRESIVVVRERNGETVSFISSEKDAVPVIENTVQAGSTIYADDALAWDALHNHFPTKRINHQECYSDGIACTNHAESFFSRIRRAEIGIHHKIAGPYLGSYASEMAWREDNRRRSNGAQYLSVVGAALRHPVSRQWKGYWQRRAA